MVFDLGKTRELIWSSASVFMYSLSKSIVSPDKLRVRSKPSFDVRTSSVPLSKSMSLSWILLISSGRNPCLLIW